MIFDQLVKKFSLETAVTDKNRNHDGSVCLNHAHKSGVAHTLEALDVS